MDKDWTGNGNSVYKTLGASNHTDKERQADDYYATDPVAIDLLREHFDIPLWVWECACGEGASFKPAGEAWPHRAVLRHCRPRLRQCAHGFPQRAVPISFEDTDCCILTNPPYKYATEFVEHALDILPVGAPAIFLLKTTALEGKGRWARLYRHGWLHEVYQFRERLLCARNGDFDGMRAGGGSAVSYAWFVFRRTPARNTVIKWI